MCVSGCLLHSLPLLLIAVFQTGTEVKKKNPYIYSIYVFLSRVWMEDVTGTYCIRDNLEQIATVYEPGQEQTNIINLSNF